MVFLFFSAVLFFCTFCGVGLLASRLSFFKAREGNFFLSYFTGFAFIGVYFSFVQLFLPLTVWTLIPVLLAGLCGLALCREEIKGRIAAAPLFFAVCLFFFYLIAYIISGKDRIDAYDDFLYHASIVSWLNAYKVVPGIANLHFRLGMNSLYLQVAAGLDVGVWDKRSCSITVFLMYFSFLMYCLRGIHAAVRKPSSVNVRLAVCQAVMALWLFFTESAEPYLNYDNPALILIAVVICEMLPYSLGDGELGEGIARTPWETIFLYSAASFAIKPMGAVAVFLVFAAAVAWTARRGKLSIIALLRLSALPICILALFVIRNVIQTGYLMFPMTVLKLDLPWTLSKYLVDTNIVAIQNYSRTIALGYEYVPGQGFGTWFVPWLKYVLPESNNILLPFVLLAGLVIAAFSLRTGNGAASIPVRLLFYFFVLGNLLFCFISVPELRYDTVWVYALPAVALFFSPGICSCLASLSGKAWGGGRRLAARLSALSKSKRAAFALSAVFLLLSLLLLLPAVRQSLIAFGSALARHELNASHWQGVFGRWGRVFLSLSVLLLLSALVSGYARERGFKAPYALLLAFVVVSSAFRDRNWLLPAAMYSFPVEKRLVSEEQAFYVYVALEGDQCGDAPLPCTPGYCFTDKLRLFDADDMGKGFYIKN